MSSSFLSKPTVTECLIKNQWLMRLTPFSVFFDDLCHDSYLISPSNVAYLLNKTNFNKLQWTILDGTQDILIGSMISVMIIFCSAIFTN